MTPSSKITNPTHDDVANKIHELLVLLARTSENREGITTGVMENGKDSDLIITFSNNENGKSAATRFLNKIEAGKLINSNELNTMKTTMESGMNSNSNLFFRIKMDEETIKIIFNHHSHFSGAMQGLDSAIKSATDDFKEKEKLEKVWTKSFPSPNQIVSDYLEQKLKFVISPMLTKRKIKVSSQEVSDSVYKFTATVNHNQKTDHEKIDRLIMELNKIFGNGGKVKKLENDSKIIGFSVTDNPAFLVGYIKMNDRKSLPLHENAACAIR